MPPFFQTYLGLKCLLPAEPALGRFCCSGNNEILGKGQQLF